MLSKLDIVTSAYEDLRISGLTVAADPDDIKLGLKTLESMVIGWTNNGVNIGYKASNDLININPNTDSGIPDWAFYAVKVNLACKLSSAFGKQPTPQMLADAKAFYDGLFNVELIQRETNTMLPVGSGNAPYADWNDYPPPDDNISVENDGNLT